MTIKHLHFIGFGYCAQAVWQRLRGEAVFSSSFRSDAKAKHLESMGIIPDNSPREPSHILCSAPQFAPPESSAWMGYLSSTGVYGDHDGGWVDETSECKAATPRTLTRLETERQWLEKGAHIFRLGGIYGLGRNVLEDAIHTPTRAIEKAGQYFSRIHVEDIAGAVIASMKSPNQGAIYNVVDDVPSSAREVMEYAHTLLQLPPPEIVPYEAATLSPMAQEFYAANRRVSNAKLKRELAYELLYPSYKEGLHAIYHALKRG